MRRLGNFMNMSEKLFLFLLLILCTLSANEFLNELAEKNELTLA